MGAFGQKLKRPRGKPIKFNRFTKEDIRKSAAEAHQLFLEQAEPFLSQFTAIKNEDGKVLLEFSELITTKKKRHFISKIFWKKDEK